MADKTASEVPDYIRRFQLVERMTELNSRHLKSEARRGGLEVEIARCEEAMARGDGSEDFRAALDAAQHELTEVEQARQDIDQERARLSAALSALEEQSRNDA